MIENKNKDENKTAVKTVSMIIFATAFSKVLGLARNIIMAYYYGGSAEKAAFETASKIPVYSFDIFLGAAILGVFIPIYNSFNPQDEKEKTEADEFANIFLNVVILVTGLLAFLGILFANQIIDAITGGYEEETKRFAVDLLRILFPAIIFTGSVYTFTGILQSKGEFLVPALVSAVSNAGIIIYFLFFKKYFGIYGVGVAYLISWAIQLLTVFIPLNRKKYKYKYKYKFKIDLKNPAFSKAVKAALPIMAGAWLLPAVGLIGQHFLSFSENPKFYVSAFGYSTEIFALITGILTYGICNYIFPKLAQNAGNNQGFADIVKTGLSSAFFVIAPVSCTAYVLRGEAVAVLYMRGEFTPELAQITSQMFAMLAPAMLMFSVIEILNRAFYSKNLVKFPMTAAISGITVNFILCWIFIEKLKLPPVYITLASFICQTATAAILIISLKIKIKEIFDIKFTVNIAKTVLSSVILLIIIKIIYFALNNNAFEAGIIKNIVVSLGILISGAAVYFISNLILRTEEVKLFIKIFKKQKINN